MNHAVVAKNLRKPRILVAPLDWGLGHATRSIPIIRELLAQGAEPWLAGEGAQQQLLGTEFPDLPFIPLKGYRVRYASTPQGLITQMLVQSPRLLHTIKEENRWLRQAVKDHGFDAVISDNRFGLYHDHIPSTYISHQLAIRSPLGEWSKRLIQKMNYRYINRFAACWIPDNAGNENLAGELSHPQKMPSIPASYIGTLSRFKKTNEQFKKGHLLFILSGPEPQRSILEEKIIREIAHYDGTACVVRGLPGQHPMIPSTNMIRFYNHLAATELNQEMERAEYVISRSGYSTVMDLATLEKKSILIPTPGQTEQEYLGEYLYNTGFAYSLPQKKFSLKEALRKAGEYKYRFPEVGNGNLLREAVARLMHSI